MLTAQSIDQYAGLLAMQVMGTGFSVFEFLAEVNPVMTLKVWVNADSMRDAVNTFLLSRSLKLTGTEAVARRGRCKVYRVHALNCNNQPTSDIIMHRIY